MARDIHRTIETVWRMESTKLIAALTRVVRDVGTAEELAQDALVAALEQWPSAGIPQRPAAWLMATAKHKAIDRIRRNVVGEQKQQELAAWIPREEEPDWDAALDDPIGDDVLRLMFISCHPVLSVEARVALTLRLLGGLRTDEIARAFLVAESTVAQRIVRAKRTLSQRDIPFELPPPAELAERLRSVLDVIYLVFNEGYVPSSGEAWARPDLCHEALRLGRILAGLAPGEPEAHGLVALMEIQASRLRARFDSGGRPLRLADQDRGRWDRLLIERGQAALERARRPGGEPGPYLLQAEIAACHARAVTFADTDWTEISRLYEKLSLVAPSPVVELNRAVALGMAYGPEVGLSVVDQLASEPRLAGYALLPAVRGDLLERAGRPEQARTEFARAASLTRNEAERRMLLDRAGQPFTRR
ncbi:MAG: RNA polymerase sigma factor [Actinomycetota bacterium]